MPIGIPGTVGNVTKMFAIEDVLFFLTLAPRHDVADESVAQFDDEAGQASWQDQPEPAVL